MATPFLLTGVTGGLGAKILQDMLHAHHIPPSNIVATSRSASNAARYQSQGLHFRVADYDQPSTLESAFENVENLLFMSSSQRDTAKRNREHRNVVDAAKLKGVKKVWYVSLAFGGFGDGSEIVFQQTHYETENLLKASGLDFVSLRAGVYSDAFPLFLNWYPSSKTVSLPIISPPAAQGRVAFATRAELGEAMATLLSKGLEAFPSIRPRTEKNVILLTSQKTDSLVDLVAAINRGRGSDMPVEYLEPQAWIEESTKDDEGGKPRAWFEMRLAVVQGLANGDAETTDLALETLLGRVPKTGAQAVEWMVKADSGYTWPQNHA